MKNDRYSRQQLFSKIGNEGQERIENSHVAVIGAGALGSSSLDMLVRAGVGKVTIIDRDYVELSNLQRQQLFTEKDVQDRVPKAIAAKERLTEINSEINIKAKVEDATPETLEALLPVDLIVDALDNFETRMMINDFCQQRQISWIYGACVGSYGLTYTILPDNSACLHCLMEEIPMDGETCETAGIIAPTIQMVTAYQVTEALKILTGNTKDLRKTLVAFDLWTNEASHLSVASLKKANCTSCGKDPDYPYLRFENKGHTEVLCGREAVQVRPPRSQVINFNLLRERYRSLVEKENAYLLVMQLEGKRVVLFQDGRAIIHGESDKTQARSLYQKYIGG